MHKRCSTCWLARNLMVRFPREYSITPRSEGHLFITYFKRGFTYHVEIGDYKEGSFIRILKFRGSVQPGLYARPDNVRTFKVPCQVCGLGDKFLCAACKEL